MPHSSFVDTPRHGVLVYGTAGAVDIVWVTDQEEGRRMVDALTEEGLCVDFVLLAERHRPAPGSPLPPRVRFRSAQRIQRLRPHAQTPLQ